MPDCHAGRASGRVRLVRTSGARLQLVPESSLPKVPEFGAGPLAGPAPRAHCAHQVLPCRLHAARGAPCTRPAQPKRIYDLLLECAARTLLEFGESRLNAQLGVTTVLHTWTRDLRFHPHAHCIVTAGGLHQQEDRWVPVRGRFLFRVELLSMVFRGKFLDGLTRLYHAQQLDLHRGAAGVCRSLRGTLGQGLRLAQRSCGRSTWRLGPSGIDRASRWRRDANRAHVDQHLGPTQLRPRSTPVEH